MHSQTADLNANPSLIAEISHHSKSTQKQIEDSIRRCNVWNSGVYNGSFVGRRTESISLEGNRNAIECPHTDSKTSRDNETSAAKRTHVWEFLERECVCKGGSLRQTLAPVELSGCQPCLVVLREFPGLSSAVEPHSLRAHVRLSTDVHMHTHAQSHHLDAAVGRWGQRAMAMECWRNLKRKGEGGQIQ